MTFYDATVRARALLIDAGLQPQTATMDAELLARHALGWDLATWLARRHEEAGDEFIDRYEPLLQRRRLREPVAYIRGVQEFWGRDFMVTPAVLIPRPETELVVELAAKYLADRPGATVVDVGTGSGCLAVTLALEHPTIRLRAVDISEPALLIARQNAMRLGGAERVTFICGSLLDSIAPPVDLIVANPPYIAARDRRGLSPEVREYEPGVALFGGEDGWRDIRALLQRAPEVLSADGLMLMEFGYGQAEHIVDEVATMADFVLEGVASDLQGIPRVLSLRRRM